MQRLLGVLVGVAAVLCLLLVWPYLVGAGDRGVRSVHGVVLDRGGNPVADAQVTLVLPANDSSVDGAGGVPLQRQWADTDGAFELVTTARGPLELEVRAGGFTTERCPVGAGPHRVVLTPEAAIDGRVVDAAGAPLPSVQVRATADDDPALQLVAWTRWDGTFRLRVPADRSYLVESSTVDGERAEPRRGVVAGGPQLELRVAPR